MAVDDARADAFVYDQVAYPSYVHELANPDLICAAGQFYRWQAPDPATASVLDIGCGDGMNVIAIAAEHPGTRCAGFDLSAPAIDRGRELLADFGIGNVELEHADILTFPREGEKFDYILCHGVLTWVPQHVRPAIFEVIAGRLAPGGVAYFGYDALPAAASKAAIIDFLCRRVSEAGVLSDQLASVTEMVRVLARNQNPQSRLKPQLDDLLAGLPRFSANYFLHDWLETAYAPMSVRDLAEAANAAGLAFAGDAMLADLFSFDIDPEGQALLRASMGSLVNFAADLDVMRGSRMFRTDMLVRQDAPPPRGPGSPAVTYAFTGQRTDSTSETGQRKVNLSVPGRGGIDLMDGFDIAVAEWISDRTPLEFTTEQVAAGTGLEAAGVDLFLRRFAIMGLIDIHSTPANFTLAPGDRPVAGPIGRALAGGSAAVADLRHKSIQLQDEFRRRLLVLADGSRTRDDLTRDLADTHPLPPVRQEIDAAIAELAKLRLFSA